MTGTFKLLNQNSTIQASRVVYNDTNEYLISRSSGPAFPTTNVVEGMLFYNTSTRELYIRSVSNTWKLVYSSALTSPVTLSNTKGSASTTGFIKYATSAEVNSATITDKVVSPQTLGLLTASSSRAGLTKLGSAGVATPLDVQNYLSINNPETEGLHHHTGYQELANGVVMCWGTYRARNRATYGVVLPVRFQGAPLTIMVNQKGASYGTWIIEAGVRVSAAGSGYFNVSYDWVGDTGGQWPVDQHHDWVAIGKRETYVPAFNQGRITSYTGSHSTAMSLAREYWRLDDKNGTRVSIITSALSQSHQMLVREQDGSGTWRPSGVNGDTNGNFNRCAFMKAHEGGYGVPFTNAGVIRANWGFGLFYNTSSTLAPSFNTTTQQFTVPFYGFYPSLATIGTSRLVLLDRDNNDYTVHAITDIPSIDATPMKTGLFWFDGVIPYTSVHFLNRNPILTSNSNCAVIRREVRSGSTYISLLILSLTGAFEVSSEEFTLPGYTEPSELAISGDGDVIATVESVSGTGLTTIKTYIRNWIDDRFDTGTTQTITVQDTAGSVNTAITYMGDYLLTVAFRVINGNLANSRVRCYVRSHYKNLNGTWSNLSTMYLDVEFNTGLSPSDPWAYRFDAGDGDNNRNAHVAVLTIKAGNNYRTIFLQQ